MVVTDRVSVEVQGLVVEKAIRRQATAEIVRLRLSLAGDSPAAVRVADVPGDVSGESLSLHPESDCREHTYDGEALRFEVLVPGAGDATVTYGVTGLTDDEVVPASEPDVEAAVVLDVEDTDEVPGAATLFPTPLDEQPPASTADHRTDADDGLSAQVTETLLGTPRDPAERPQSGGSDREPVQESRASSGAPGDAAGAPGPVGDEPGSGTSAGGGDDPDGSTGPPTAGDVSLGDSGESSAGRDLASDGPVAGEAFPSDRDDPSDQNRRDRSGVPREGAPDAVDGGAPVDGARAGGELAPDSPVAAGGAPSEPPVDDGGPAREVEATNGSGSGDRRTDDEEDPLEHWVEPATVADEYATADATPPGVSLVDRLVDELKAGDVAQDRLEMLRAALRPDGPRTGGQGEASLQSRISAVEQELSSVADSRETPEGLERQLRALEERQADDYAAIQTAIEEVGESVDELIAVLDDVTDDLAEVERSLEETRADVGDLRQTHQSDVSELHGEIEEVRAVTEGLQAESDAGRQRLDREVAELAADLEANRWALKTLREEVENLSDLRTKMREFFQPDPSSSQDDGSSDQ